MVDLLLIYRDSGARCKFGKRPRALEKLCLLYSGEAVQTSASRNLRKYFRSDAAMVVLGARSICAWGWVDTFVVQLDGFPGAEDISGPPKMRL
jgi:hypothetical protein